ncbi:MAG: EthD family reductase, partial [Acidisphaera sp.]|nr:EthD family reductase [Acidisphaera sp.]
TRFDLDYYMNTHMPLVRERFGPFGLQSDRVLRGAGGPRGGKGTYQIMALLTFASRQSIDDALAAHGREVIGDIKNYTDAEAIMQFAEDVPR